MSTVRPPGGSSREHSSLTPGVSARGGRKLWHHKEGALGPCCCAVIEGGARRVDEHHTQRGPPRLQVVSREE